MSENREGTRYVYRLAKDEVATNVGIGNIDLHILNTYKKLWRMPRTAVLHAMIGRSVKCWEENHDDFIIKLQEKNRTLAKIVVAYLEKYGPITKKDLNKADKEIKAGEKGTSPEKDAISEQ